MKDKISITTFADFLKFIDAVALMYNLYNSTKNYTIVESGRWIVESE